MLTHKGTQTLETDRLVLRKIQNDDAQALFEGCFSVPEVTKYLRYDTHKNIEETYRVMARWEKEYERPDKYFWVITLKESGLPIGTVGAGVHDNDRCADFGYQIAKSMWNKGYMTEALDAIIKFLFEEVGVNRIEAFHSVANPASGAVMRRCGMQYEGMCREKYYCSEGYQDSHMYGILKSDFKRSII